MITGEISPITLVDFGEESVRPILPGPFPPMVPPPVHDKIIFSNPDVSDYPAEVSSEDYCAALPPVVFGPFTLCFPLMGSDSTSSTVTFEGENWEICRNSDNECHSGSLPGIIRGSLPSGETIDGTSLNDRIFGNAGDDIINGMCGTDQIRGEGGND